MVRVSDRAGFVVSNKQQTLAIGAGETARLVVTAKVASDVKLGKESIVSVDVASGTTPTRSTYGSVELEVTENLDHDLDNILDAQDNCKTQSNPDQLDYDHDGVGNACDTTPGEPPKTDGCRTTPAGDTSSAWWAAAALVAALSLLRSLKRASRARSDPR